MDPLTHTLLTYKFISKKPLYLSLANAPDLPFYLTYPAWVIKQGKMRAALESGVWPDPPKWLETVHHILHSIPVALLVGLSLYTLRKRWPHKLLATWLLHILIDIPTHSRAQWGPRFLWPFSNFAVDGVSWVTCLQRLTSRRDSHTTPKQELCPPPNAARALERGA